MKHCCGGAASLGTKLRAPEARRGPPTLFSRTTPRRPYFQGGAVLRAESFLLHRQLFTPDQSGLDPTVVAWSAVGWGEADGESRIAAATGFGPPGIATPRSNAS